MLKKAHVHMTAGILAVLAAVEAGAGFIVSDGSLTLPVILLGVSAALTTFVQVYRADSEKDPPSDA